MFCMTRSYRKGTLSDPHRSPEEGNNKNSMWALFMIRNVKKQRPVNLDLKTIRFPVSAIMNSFFVKFIMWGILTALAYHVVGGVRHMLMDFGYLEETFEAGKRTANISFVITVVLSLLAGVLVW